VYNFITQVYDLLMDEMKIDTTTHTTSEDTQAEYDSGYERGFTFFQANPDATDEDAGVPNRTTPFLEGFTDGFGDAAAEARYFHGVTR
jgi:hypothetical protein